MENLSSTCCKTKIKPNKTVGRTSGSVSFLSTLLIILLPKCPLCVTAYMSAILLFFDIDNGELAPILMHAKPVLGIVILIMILINYKGQKTILSATIAGIVTVLIFLNNYFYIAVMTDWILYAAFLFAIWYNGNFEYFFRFIRSRIPA